MHERSAWREGEDGMSGGTLARGVGRVECESRREVRGGVCNSSFSFRSEAVTSSYLGEGTSEGMV